MMIRNRHYTLLFVFSYGVVFTVPAQAQDGCDVSLLEEAHRVYELDFFSRAISQLEPCLPDGFQLPAQRVQAHRLVALAYYELGNEQAAAFWIRSLMEINRRYTASAEDPPFFRDRVVAFRPKAWYQRRWVQIGISAASGVGGVVAYLLLRPENESPPPPGPPPGPLPGFPGFPDNN